jgi:hypothetical protein
MADKIQYHGDIVDRVFEAKKEYHRNAAKLPIEEKVRILVELQKIAVAIKNKDMAKENRLVWKIE